MGDRHVCAGPGCCGKDDFGIFVNDFNGKRWRQVAVGRGPRPGEFYSFNGGSIVHSYKGDNQHNLEPDQYTIFAEVDPDHHFKSVLHEEMAKSGEHLIDETDLSEAVHKDKKPRSLEWRLREFWLANAYETADMVVPKAVEYGASDLKIMGQAMEGLLAAARKGTGKEPLDAESLRVLGLEAALAFYQLGKVARIFGALERGEEASDDTILDNDIYSTMLRKVRKTGVWV